MNDKCTLKGSVERITSLFSSKKGKEESKKTPLEKQKYMRLNFLFLTTLIKETKKYQEGKRETSFFPLFTAKILNSKNPHLIEITKQAYSCCNQQDLHFFPFKQFFLCNEFAMRQIIEWRLSKYIRSKDNLRLFVEVMQETPPDTFRHHFITLINQENEKEKDLTEEQLNKTEKEQENKWILWKHHVDGDPLRVSRT